ncbi:MAG: hypothetical protein JO265_00140 [Acidimicrobiia bacterium]|nr:hypothetical protein [Acidimicrobiia bacterium]
MSTQQPADNRNQQDPYPADQQFGKAAAEDQERVDRGELPREGGADTPGEPGDGDGEPRAANKADDAVS